MSLRDKYNAAIQAAKGFRMDGAAEERDGKLFIRGTVASEDQKNSIWDAIKTVPDYAREVHADIQVKPATGGGAGVGGGAGDGVGARAGASTTAPAGAAAPGRTYTVRPGDTLSKIARQELGDANAYMQIFNANRDLLNDPDKIQPGQVLKIPR